MSVFQTIKSLLFYNIIGPAVALLMTLAVIYFLWGVMRYIMGATDPEKRIQGRKHMIYGVLGLAIMISAFGIGAFIFGSIKSLSGSSDTAPSILQPGNQHF